MTALLLLATACTDEELETDSAPYTGSIEYSIPAGMSDSLYLTADRIVHLTTYSMAVKTSDGGTGTGRFIFNSPLKGSKNKLLTQYPVRIGPYAVTGMGGAYKDYEPHYMDTIRHGSASTVLQVRQKAWTLDDESYRRLLSKAGTKLSGWKDYNAYTTAYLAPLTKPLVRASTEMLYVEKDQVTQMPVSVDKRSLTLTVTFTIEKDLSEEPFAVQRVETELAGVPRQMELHSGTMPTDSTCKVFYPTKLAQADKYTEQQVSCSGTFEVLSLVAPRSPSLMTGPGILQLLIYVRTKAGQTRMIHGSVNLYNAIRKTQIAEYSDDGASMRNTATAATLHVNAPCRITAQAVQSDITQVSGLEKWQSCGEMVVIESDSQVMD